MSNLDQYDILIIGSGEAGKYLGWTMAKAGRRTAVVERRLIGGSCPNIACLPSKNIIHSAKVADLVRRAADFGITTGPVKIEMPGVRARKRKMVDDLISLHLDRYKASGAELILGEASFVGAKTVEVKTREGETRRLAGERVFLNVGSRAAIPDVPGLQAAKPLTHVEALELDRVPEHLVVLGGGFVGLELAQAMRRFGSRVTMLVRGPQLGEHEDDDVGNEILRLFQDEDIEVLLKTDLLNVEGISGQQIRMRVRDSRGERTITGSDILVAAGRVPNTQGLGLERAGVKLDDRGYIRVNDRLQTTAPDTWAMGDCAGSPQFTHVAYDDFRIVNDNLNGGNRTTRGRLVPFCLFTDPELARVGLNESEARKLDIPYRLARIPISAVLRTRTLSETRGFLKALISTENDEILGFTALGVHAGELMAVVQTAMLAKLPYTALRDAILTHPTMAEGLIALFSSVAARSNTVAGEKSRHA
jgi:pyruvate/2-oxoglutarate dehydrogenase complex dihydrolipoamide dehydrogenase (E3) component